MPPSALLALAIVCEVTGTAFLGEPATALKFVSLALVIAGVVGLNLA